MIWLGGFVPGGGGVATFGDSFGLSSDPTVTLDVNPTLSGLNFDTNFIYTIAGGTLNLNAGSPFTLNATRSHESPPGFFAFGHRINSTIAGTANAFVKTGSGSVTLSGTNTFTAPISILGGRLGVTSGDAALGNAANTLTFDGGSLLTSTTALTTSRSVTIGTGGGTINPFAATTLNGTLNGTGMLKIAGSTAGLTIGGDASGFTGAIQVEQGTLTIAGNGQIGGTTGLDIAGSLVLNNTATNNSNRIADGRAVTLRGAEFSLFGNATGTAETVGTLRLASGDSMVTVTSTTASSSLRFSDLQRDDRSTVYFRGTNLGTQIVTASQILFTNSPGTLIGGGGALNSSNISILPFARGSKSDTATTATDFVSWDSASKRIVVLGPSNYVSTIGTATANDNVNVDAAQSVKAGGQTVNSLRIGSTLSGGSGDVLTINSGAILTSAEATISVPVAFAAGREGVIHATSFLTMNGPISGNNGLTLTGDGLFETTGRNTYSGQTTIAGGTVIASGLVDSRTAGPFGIDNSAIVLSSNSSTGGSSIGSQIISNGLLTINRDIVFNGGGSTFSTLGTFFGVGQSVKVNGNIQINNLNSSSHNGFLFLGGNRATQSDVTVNGVISGDGGVQSGIDTYTFLNGNNTYSGGTILSGDFSLGHNNALGTGPVWLSGTLIADGADRSIGNVIHVFDFAAFGGDNALNLNGDVLLRGSGFLTGGTQLTVNTTGAGVTINGVMSGGSMVKDSTGALTLTANNTYTGSTTVRNGTLILGGNAGVGSGVLGTNPNTTLGSAGTVALGDGATTASSNIALLTNGPNTIGRSIQINAQNSNGSTTIGGTNTSGTANYAGQINLSRATTNITSASGGTVAFTGPITQTTTAGLNLNGSGIVTFSGANTYSGGTTVNKGTLYVNNTTGSGTGSGAVSVAAQATLGGNGLIAGGVMLQNGAMLSPGTSPGNLTMGSLAMISGSTFRWELDITGSTTTFDTLTILPSGTLDFGANVTSVLSFTGGVNSAYWNQDHSWLVFNNGTGTTNGTITNISVNNLQNGGWNAGLGPFAWAHSGNNLNLNFISAVPEPSSFALLGLAGVSGLFAVWKRKKRRIV